MIHFNPETKTFNLLLKTSYYAFQADHENHLVHLGWGPRPGGTGEALLLSGRSGYETSDVKSFEHQTRRDELITFGDVSYHEVSLKVNFSVLPETVKPGEAPYLPIRDVRLRYTGHEIVTMAQPGLAPAHGQPPAKSDPRETLRVFLQDPAQPFA